MSINIPAETPDESTNPISVEEFERLHPAMLGAIKKPSARNQLERLSEQWATTGGATCPALTCEESASRSDGSCRPAT
ncbi:MAG: hypothetical protein ACLUA4_05585 [Bifidobacterium sp.]